LPWNPASLRRPSRESKDSGIPYGDNPREQENMKGPGMTAGAKGLGKAVYFKDPDGHLQEIKTY